MAWNLFVETFQIFDNTIRFLASIRGALFSLFSDSSLTEINVSD